LARSATEKNRNYLKSVVAKWLFVYNKADGTASALYATHTNIIIYTYSLV
jgi:hypothetical protein